MTRRHRVVVRRGNLLSAAPWMRAPVLLLRRPTAFVAIALACAVLAIAASSGVFFVSTLSTASLRVQAADDCPEASMPTMTANVQSGHLAAENTDGAAAMSAAGALGTPYWVEGAGAQIQATYVSFYARAGALDHVATLTPKRGQPGVWFPDDFAIKLHLKPGEVIRTTDTGVPITVAGIYRALSPDPFHLAALPRYWCTWNDQIVQKVSGNEGTPPFLISDVNTVAQVTAGLGRDSVYVSWYDPIPIDRISAAAARRANQHAARANTTYLASTSWARPVPKPTEGAHSTLGPPDQLATKLATADRVQSGLSGSVLPIDLAGVFVALLLVAGAGLFWAAHRSREITLLTARGVGPGALAVKAVLECLPAALLGLASGCAASLGLIRLVGPAADFGPGAPARAFAAAAVAVLVGLLLVGGIGARAARDRPIGQAISRRRHLPWELLLVGLAVWSWLQIRDGRGIEVQHTIVHVDPVVLLFPLLGGLAS